MKQKILRHVGIAMNDEELVRLKEVAEFIKAQLGAEHQPKLFSADEAATQAIEAKKLQDKNKSTALNVDLTQLKEIQLTIIGIHEMYEEIYQQRGFNEIFGKAKSQQTKREILKQITIARIAQPESKRVPCNYLSATLV